MSEYYRIVKAESCAELEQAAQAVIAEDASWQPLGGAFVRDRTWFQAVYRRPSCWRRLWLFVRKAARHGEA